MADSPSVLFSPDTMPNKPFTATLILEGRDTNGKLFANANEGYTIEINDPSAILFDQHTILTRSVVINQKETLEFRSRDGFTKAGVFKIRINKTSDPDFFVEGEVTVGSTVVLEEAPPPIPALSLVPALIDLKPEPISPPITFIPPEPPMKPKATIATPPPIPGKKSEPMSFGRWVAIVAGTLIVVFGAGFALLSHNGSFDTTKTETKVKSFKKPTVTAKKVLVADTAPKVNPAEDAQKDAGKPTTSVKDPEPIAKEPEPAAEEPQTKETEPTPVASPAAPEATPAASPAAEESNPTPPLPSVQYHVVRIKL